MKLRNPVMCGGRIMLQSGRELTHADVHILRRRFPDMNVRIEDPLLDSLIEFEDDSRDREVAALVQYTVSRSLCKVHERFSERAYLRGTDLVTLHRAVNELMEYLKANRTTAAVVNECLDPRGHLATHTGNVFYLSMLLASSALDYVAAENKRLTLVRDLPFTRATDLASLGLGAMLMDLGMLPLQHLYNTDYILTNEDRQALHRHPLTGAEALPECLSPVARAVVRTHHENFAGTGYPMRTPGDRIHVFARIVRIADAFDAAISERAYRGAKTAARALWEMTDGPYRRFYDPHLMHVFSRLIQPFPIGAKLRLRDGRFAVVVRYNRGNPFKPTVIVAYDPQERPLPREKLGGLVNLAGRNDVRIASFRGEDLSFVYSNIADDAPPRYKFIKPLDALYP